MWWVSSPTEPASKSHFPRSAGEKETSREILIGVPSYHFPLPAAEIITDHKPIQLHGFFSFFFSNCVFWSIRRIENWRSANASQLEDLDSADAKVLKNPKIQKFKNPSETQMQMRRLWNKWNGSISNWIPMPAWGNRVGRLVADAEGKLPNLI